MRAVVERVCRAAVKVVEGGIAGAIKDGLLVYAAATTDDTEADLQYIADKVAHLRVFTDDDGKLNRSLLDTGGGVLLVSAFSVGGDARRGRRPSFDGAAPGETARPLIDQLAAKIRAHGITVATGEFATHMRIAAVNDGPICILLDSKKTF